MLKTKELFELPVYRLEEDKYNQSLCDHIDNNPLMSAENSRKAFGGDWNEHGVSSNNRTSNNAGITMTALSPE